MLNQCMLGFDPSHGLIAAHRSNFVKRKKKKKKRVEKEEGDVIAHVRVFLTLLFRNPFLMQPLSLASGAHLDDTFFSLWSFICGRNDIREPVFFFFFFFSEAARGALLNLCSLSLTHSTVLEIGVIECSSAGVSAANSRVAH